MATLYVGYRNVLSPGVYPLDPATKRYDYLSSTGVFDGFPDKPLTDVYNKLYGNAKIQTQWSPMADPGDRAGTFKPNPLYFYGVPSAQALGGTTGWSTSTTDVYRYYGLASATVLDKVGINTAQLDYYHFDGVSGQPLAGASRPVLAGMLSNDDVLVWKGTPSSKAL